VARHTQLADHQDIQRRMQRLSYFKSDRHAAARNRQHDDIQAPPIL
jgi:hypothetical protein